MPKKNTRKYTEAEVKKAVKDALAEAGKLKKNYGARTGRAVTSSGPGIAARKALGVKKGKSSSTAKKVSKIAHQTPRKLGEKYSPAGGLQSKSTKRGAKKK